MHEIGVVRQMCRTVMDFAAENNIQSISEIVVEIGELSLIIPKYVEDVYPLVTEGTMLSDTKLIMETVPGLAECDDCDEIFNVVEHEGYCPNCRKNEKVTRKNINEYFISLKDGICRSSLAAQQVKDPVLS